jgi:SAM-dependent methyltransferase
MGLINSLFAHPLTKILSVDDPRTTEIRYEIIQSKPFLKAVYQDWYKIIIRGLGNSKNILEIGSGAGFLKIYIPSLFTSEVMEVKNVDLVADATQLPFPDKSLDAIVMTDVLHHIPSPKDFFSEAARCLRIRGKILMIEPWPTPWSEFVYKNFHSEPFNKDGDWTIPLSGPLSGANGALPWILFHRDLTQFKESFPQIKITNIKLMMPFSYLMSGGVSLRFSVPGFLYTLTRYIESKLNQQRWAMFAYIEIELLKTEA